MVDGVPRIESHLEWQMTPHTDPAWNIRGCYITQITGDPMVYNKHMIFPPRRGPVESGELRIDRDDGDGLPALNSIGPSSRRPQDRHQQRPTAACLCGPLQTLRGTHHVTDAVIVSAVRTPIGPPTGQPHRR